jgi:hypothetical protein
MTWLRAGERGQATVELALCLPLLALALGALVEIGLLVSDQIRLWHAAREAARVAIVDPEMGHIRDAAERSGLIPVRVDVDPPEADRRSGEALTVAVTYTPRGHVPLLGRVFARNDLEAAATMRIEQP